MALIGGRVERMHHGFIRLFVLSFNQWLLVGLATLQEARGAPPVEGKHFTFGGRRGGLWSQRLHYPCAGGQALDALGSHVPSRKWAQGPAATDVGLVRVVSAAGCERIHKKKNT